MLRAAVSHTSDSAGVDLDALRATVATDHEIADTAHDISHLDRVAALAGWIAERIGADPVQATVAAYVHEYHRVAEARTGVRPLPVHVANDLVRAVLDAHQVPRRWYPDILCAVDATGRYRIAGDSLPAELAVVCPVAAAVHDADNLDAIGVVGLARAVGYGAVLGEPLWDRTSVPRAGYVDRRTSSIVAHCYEKLVHLADEMLTAPGRRLARQRQADLLAVLGRLRSELVADPAQRASWDPHTGYLRLPLHEAQAADCRLEFTAGVRLAVRDGEVCYVELYAMPTVARTILTGSGGAFRPSMTSGGLRIPVRPADPASVVVGPAAVQLELAEGLPLTVTLHLRTQGADLDEV